jgi:choline dehydrogenase-like flavoprotein
MLRDAVELPEGERLVFDVCIVGGGIAGIALAQQFLAEDLRVCVLESGGLDIEVETQRLYQGEARLEDGTGSIRPIDDYMTNSRFRLLGGSGNVWGGKCGVLDPVDFEPRPWMPDSGWPLRREQLDPYYERACKTLKVAAFDYDPNAPFDPQRPPSRIGDAFETVTRHHSPIAPSGPEEALRKFRESVTQAPRLQVLLHANAVEVAWDGGAGTVQRIDAATLQGNRFSVQAKFYVLASGGIENVRLLLASRSGHAAGIGNAQDLVGRFFTGHVVIGLDAMLYCSDPHTALDLYTGKDRSQPWGVYSLARAVQRKHKMSNFTVTLNPLRGSLSDAHRDVMESVYIMDQGVDLADSDGFDPQDRLAPIYFMMEQQCHPKSRITLTDQRDALGMQQPRLVWRFDDYDFDNLERGVRLFGQELGSASWGRLRVDLSQVGDLEGLGLSRHHMGATRMHADPALGVVDADCRIHGLDNLYVAGSSVFPTPGIANPTLTLVALAHRLGDHLKQRLSS